MMNAVIDRFEGKYAVLIIGDGEQRMNVLRKLLPAQASEGSWLQIEIEDGQLLQAVIDDEATLNARQRISEKLARLRRGEHRSK